MAPPPLNAQSRFIGLLGGSVEHSLSPLIHNTALREAEVNAVYLAMAVAPERLGEAVAGLRALGALGANVTIPHKQAVIPYLDALTPVAEAIGAVNTIVRRADGTLLGDNTDAAGFLYGLGGGGELRIASALVFGAGGAARAVVYALLTECRLSTLTLTARAPEKAEALTSDFAALDPHDVLRVVPLSEAGPAIRASRIVVNATPLGMHPHTEATPWLDAVDFGPAHTVYDLVYAPAETRLMREAAARGARTIGGLPMLVGQAAAAFSQWTGTPMPLDAVHSALRAHLDP